MLYRGSMVKLRQGDPIETSNTAPRVPLVKLITLRQYVILSMSTIYTNSRETTSLRRRLDFFRRGVSYTV